MPRRPSKTAKGRQKAKKTVKPSVTVASFMFFIFAALCFLTGVYVLSYKTVPWTMNGILMMFLLGGAMICHYSSGWGIKRHV